MKIIRQWKSMLESSAALRRCRHILPQACTKGSSPGANEGKQHDADEKAANGLLRTTGSKLRKLFLVLSHFRLYGGQGCAAQH